LTVVDTDFDMLRPLSEREFFQDFSGERCQCRLVAQRRSLFDRCRLILGSLLPVWHSGTSRQKTSQLALYWNWRACLDSNVTCGSTRALFAGLQSR
jgi:hypothetical protein